MAKARKWWVADRRPLKVNVSETEPMKEKQPQPEEKKAEKKSAKKERTEEELAVLPREEMYAVIADIEAGKATIKPRFINQ